MLESSSCLLTFPLASVASWALTGVMSASFATVRPPWILSSRTERAGLAGQLAEFGLALFSGLTSIKAEASLQTLLSWVCLPHKIANTIQSEVQPSYLHIQRLLESGSPLGPLQHRGRSLDPRLSFMCSQQMFLPAHAQCCCWSGSNVGTFDRWRIGSKRG